MPSIPASQVKRGQAILHNGEVYVIVGTDWVKPGKGPAYVQAKLKHVTTGKIIDNRFRSAATVETINVDRRKVAYSYDNGTSHVFMDGSTYEEIEASHDLVGEDSRFLTYGASMELQIVQGKVVSLLLPAAVVMEVVRTEPGLKNVSATDVTKPATTDTGLVVQVPVFINQGEKIKVDTTDGKYLERVNE